MSKRLSDVLLKDKKIKIDPSEAKQEDEKQPHDMVAMAVYIESLRGKLKTNNDRYDSLLERIEL